MKGIKIKDFWTCFSMKLLVYLFCFFAKDLAADILYGTIGDGSFPQSTLVVIDQNTGAVERTIGPVGYIIIGLAFDPTTGNLYATSSINDLNFTGLFIIDTTTGAGTPIRPGWPGEVLVCLACDSAGQLYA